MRTRFLCLTLCLFCLFSLVSDLSAGCRNLILRLRSGTPELEQSTESQCRQLASLLPSAQIAADKDSLIAALKQDAVELDAEDELNLFIFGHASATSRRVVLSMPGGRLGSDELLRLLDSIPAAQSVYCFNTMSAPLFHYLNTNSRRTRFLVSATDSENQLNPPRYPEFFIQALKESGTAMITPAVLKRAGDLTLEFYEKAHLMLSETSQALLDGKAVSYPFGDYEMDTMTFSDGGRNPKGSRLIRPEEPAQQLLQFQKATPETLKLASDARERMALYPQYPAFFLNRDLNLILNPDKSAAQILTELWVLRDPGFVRRILPRRNLQLYPLNGVTLILPDGSFAELKDFLPEMPSGSLLRITRKTSIPLPSHLPEFQLNFSVQTLLPVDSYRLTLTGDPAVFHHKLYQFPAAPETKSGVNAQTVSYSGGPLPVLPQMALPRNDRYPGATLVVSSLKDWTAFQQWACRLADRALTLDQKDKAFLDSLLNGAGTDLERVRRIYKYCNSLEYVTTPLGAAAFRPQKISDMIRNRYADCKDKANAIVAFCRAVGIPAERVLVNRMGNVDPAFPSWQFNHMIAYLPKLTGYPDGLFLDATDGLTPFGDLPPGDLGSTGLLLAEKKSAFLTIQNSMNPSNTDVSTVDWTIHLRPDSTASLTLTDTGYFDYLRRSSLRAMELPEARNLEMETLLDRILPGAELVSFELPDLTRKTGKSALKLEAKNVYFPPELPDFLFQTFRTPSIPRPARIFDGRPWRFTLTFTDDSRRFPVIPHRRRGVAPSPLISSEFRTEGTRLVLSIASSRDQGHSIAPSEYSAIRSGLWTLRRGYVDLLTKRERVK